MIPLPQKFAQKMLAHAQEETPYEACGLLVAKEGRVVKVYRCTNAEKSATSYTLQPEEQFKVFTEMEEKGWELFGIYHSHPRSSAYPSLRDLKMAYYPEAIHFIVSLLDEPHIRAFRIVGGEISEEELLIKD